MVSFPEQSSSLQEQTQYTINHLTSVDPILLMQRISYFRNLSIRTMSDSEIREELLKVLMWNERFMYLTNVRQLPKGTVFFRARKLKSSIIPISNFKKYSDFWEPPSPAVKEYGRLNKPGESLLYTSLGDPLVPLKEVHINENEWYALINYISKREVKINYIGGEYDYSLIGINDEKAILVHELYNDFLRTEFSRDVGKGTEYLYRISEIIAKDYFDLPPVDIQDAWAYSSIHDKKKYNVCYRPEIAHQVLDLKGAMICKKGPSDMIKVYCVAIPSVDKSSIEYYPLGSEVQKDVFPDIVYSYR